MSATPRFLITVESTGEKVKSAARKGGQKTCEDIHRQRKKDIGYFKETNLGVSTQSGGQKTTEQDYTVSKTAKRKGEQGGLMEGVAHGVILRASVLVPGKKNAQGRKFGNG